MAIYKAIPKLLGSNIMSDLTDQITNDLSAVFDEGLTLDITHNYGASSESIKVFFDRPFNAVFDGMVESNIPNILVQESESTNITKASTFTINGTTYYIIAIELSHSGVNKYFLSEDQQ